MKVRSLHPWPSTYREAVRIQEDLRSRLRLKPLRQPAALVAGADVSYSKGSPALFAAVVVLSLPELEVVETRTVKATAKFPYLPGLLSFRELPPLLTAFKRLKTRPDAVICDGQGIAHPRRFGLACHLGLLLDLPAVGCAKSLLVGSYRQPRKRRWSRTDLVDDGEVIGQVLRTREAVKPVFVSPGHQVDLEGSVALVRQCVGRYRLPETTRAAHHLVNDLRRMAEEHTD